MGLTRKEGDPFPARLECLGITTETKGLALLMAITDLSLRGQPINYPNLSEMVFDIQEGIIVTDAQKIILEVNPAFTRITGFSRQEAIGKTPRLLSSGLHDALFYQGIWQAIVQQGYWHGELWNRRKNGEVFVESLTISGITDIQGKISHYVGSFLDITACKQAEQHRLDCTRGSLDLALQQKNAELEQVKKALSEIEVALKFLVGHQKSDHFKAKFSLEQEINSELVPFISQLKKSYQDAKQLALVRILEKNLQHIVAAYGKEDALSSLYQKLTPKEIQVAAMIRQGLPTKLIAVTLSTSTATINAHRKNIRKKLGLNKESVNLRDYLARLTAPL
ncbi:MAG: PAS domain S-box protein [Methylococcales bacterium]